jgi:hypothetical protein
MGLVKDKIDDVCKEIAFPPDQILRSFRLGRPYEGKSRPIKLIFPDETKKWEFLKRINASKVDGRFVTLDLTQEEREKDYQARQRVRELRGENREAEYKIKNSKILKREGSKWTVVQ